MKERTLFRGSRLRSTIMNSGGATLPVSEGAVVISEYKTMPLHSASELEIDSLGNSNSQVHLEKFFSMQELGITRKTEIANSAITKIR